MAEHNQRFETFDMWVNKASSWLTRRGPNVKAICYDAKGRLCTRGADMMRARDEGAFPVRWLWPDQVAELATTYAHAVPAVIAPFYEVLSSHPKETP